MHDDPAAGRRRLRPESRHHLVGFRSWLREQGLDLDFVLYSNYERQVEDLVAGPDPRRLELPAGLVRAQRLAARPGQYGARRWSCATPTAT